MIRMTMSPAAAAVLRSLISRSGAAKNRILLTQVQSTDWQSLTFAGERHRIALRIAGEDSESVAERLCSGLEDAELSTSRVIVADIKVQGRVRNADGSTELTVDALTIADD